VKAVNLIPVDERRGSGGAAPVGVYALLGGLAVVLAAVTLLVLTGNQVSSKRSELSSVSTQATEAQRQATALTPYTNFAKLQKARLETVKSLASTRFQWSRAFSDVSHVIGGRIWLSGLTGTVAPGVTVESSSVDGTTQFRQTSPNPALEIAGCARTNKDVVALLSRLRAMKGVQRVTLADSEKDDNATPATDPGSSDSCGSTRYPAFQVVVFYAPLKAASASPDTGVSNTATASTTTSTTSTTPSDSSSSTSSTTSSTGGTP
jgi:Tfp pilus assembly protein PilN